LKDYIRNRVLEVAHYIQDNSATVRDAAQRFNVSKSTIHKDITERLQRINPALAQAVDQILQKNKAERHIRGGHATRLKYRALGTG
jgi:putative DeoR family transcriptional regulator (stage III sporulation protein D)